MSKCPLTRGGLISGGLTSVLIKKWVDCGGGFHFTYIVIVPSDVISVYSLYAMVCSTSEIPTMCGQRVDLKTSLQPAATPHAALGTVTAAMRTHALLATATVT